MHYIINAVRTEEYKISVLPSALYPTKMNIAVYQNNICTENFWCNSDSVESEIKARNFTINDMYIGKE